jgi:hypothetical protein
VPISPLGEEAVTAAATAADQEGTRAGLAICC